MKEWRQKEQKRKNKLENKIHIKSGSPYTKISRIVISENVKSNNLFLHKFSENKSHNDFFFIFTNRTRSTKYFCFDKYSRGRLKDSRDSKV